MSNIVKQQAFPSSLSEAIQMGKVFHESGLFSDIKSAAQAVVKIQAGSELGIPPLASLTGIHIIQGKPVIGSNLIAARVQGSGKYRYEVKQHDEKACIIDFFCGERKIGTSSFTIDDAKKAQTKNLDKFPRNMLFARAISNGVRWFCPDIFTAPVYTPEEITETIDVAHEDVPVKKTALNDKGFQKLLKRIDDAHSIIDEQERRTAMDKLVNDTMTAISLTDEQEQAFTAKIASLEGKAVEGAAA